eukprot:2781082-Amphidinium_carterae.1
MIVIRSRTRGGSRWGVQQMRTSSTRIPGRRGYIKKLVLLEWSMLTLASYFNIPPACIGTWLRSEYFIESNTREKLQEDCSETL